METLSYAQLQDELKKPGTVLIDVRDPDELTKDGKIAESKNLPLGGLNGGLKMNDADFKAKYGFDKPSKESRIICHCKSGMRAEVGCGEFKSAGFKNVCVYPGIQDWKKNGGPLVK